MGVHDNHAQKIKINERTGKNIEGKEDEMITTINLLIVGVALFSYFAFTSPEPCPRKYRVIQEHGGMLASPVDIHRYCELDYGGKFVLKAEYKE